MVFVEEFYVRVLYLVVAVGVLPLLRTPLRNLEQPGSKWLALTIGGLSTWLAGVGLYYFVHSLSGSLALYNVVLFSITVCFASWILIAVEFATDREAPRWLLVGLGAFAAVHFVLLWTNFFWLHELVYGSTTFVDAGGGLNSDRGPLFWVHIVTVYVLVFLATALFVAEWTNASGLRRRQAGILSLTPVFGVGASFLWFAEVLPFPYDPTPIGVTLGVVLLTWALYRTEFLEIAPVARQTVVEGMPDAMIVLDDESRVVDWNAAATDLFGVADPAAGMDAGSFFETVPDDTLAALADADRIDTQVALDLDGRTRHFSVRVTPVDPAGSGPTGRVVVVRDVTEMKRREQQLLRQNEYLDEFAEIVSHDLQGPLMEIRSSGNLASRTGDVSHVENVLTATDRMDQLVDDLLDLARSGRQVDEVDPVSLADVTDAAWGRVWEQDADLVVETDRTVAADSGRLQQLFENLFRNAVEHGSTSSRTVTGDVTITVGDLPDGFYVADDGPGIPPGDRDRVFEKGYTTSGDGTGLGLGIVRQIAGAHGWAVRVTEGAAGGARFEITGVSFEADRERPGTGRCDPG
jgi:PAS domain S-box-containing protein